MRIGICISLLIILTSCKNEVRFDSAEWNKKNVDWEWTEQREKMVVDLIKSDTLIGLQKNKILELLGNPSTETEKKLKYLVREKYEWNIDPEFIKYLWVELDKNGKATKCYIEKIK
ncbi:hypothetical protein [Maribacter litoralis]|uniref:hypothetical protein n=1 Tax=Maribacter litoralis TaxID=2059726 RepID=UPI000E316DC6|nr:hypothetical protein [Maribacter litoralis]